MPLQRVQHWAERPFDEFLLERAHAPFAWGVQDCAMFAADGVLAVTGVDIADDFRGKYASEDEAFALIQSVTGGEGIRAAAAWCAAKHGLVQREHPLMAQRGELVLVEESGREIAGLVHLSGRFVVCAGEAGLVRVPLRQIKVAYSYE